jgi:hypothetical protein
VPVESLDNLDDFVCSYCGSNLAFLMRSGDRKLARDFAMAETPVGSNDYAGNNVAIVDGQPLNLEIRFHHYPFLGSLGLGSGPPGLSSGDNRYSRQWLAERKLYAEKLGEALREAAPELPFAVNGRTSAESGGPGIGTDAVLIGLGALAAYPGAKLIAQDVRSVLTKLRALSATEPPPEISDGVALILARDALFERNGIADSTLRSVSPLQRQVDYYQELDGYLVNLAHEGVLYTIALNPDGRVLSITESADPWEKPSK